LSYPAPGSELLAKDILAKLDEYGISATEDRQRGFDHGTFVPLMLMYPKADIPVVQVSLSQTLDPKTHIELGQALSFLTEQSVLILGSGMSFHNMQAFMNQQSEVQQKAQAFDSWLNGVVTEQSAEQAIEQLTQWFDAPEARFAHPREEHLLPLLVCYGVAGRAGKRNFAESLLGVPVSGFVWGD